MPECGKLLRWRDGSGWEDAQRRSWCSEDLIDPSVAREAPAEEVVEAGVEVLVVPEPVARHPGNWFWWPEEWDDLGVATVSQVGVVEEVGVKVSVVLMSTACLQGEWS